ncbi:uncharacterized protein LOC143192637 [Rhynchophorus ferrugineus]|uniref:Uncharacterized protein n=1 Tax=Rhynchophorus ferrugineus TaxID=354439 RepID=A0A834HSX6_RHYFE|nr:hypothetical protein GWI33_020179 [Rhynchophorus ferrugineus]
MRFAQILCALVVVVVCSASPAKHHRSIPKGQVVGRNYYGNPRYARQEAEAPELAEPLADLPQEPDFLNETEPQEDLPQEDQGSNIDDQVSLESGTTEATLLAAEPSSDEAAEPSSDAAAEPSPDAAAEPSPEPAAEVPAEVPSDEPAPAAEDAAPEALAPPEPIPVPAPSPALVAPAPAPVAPAPAPAAPAPAPVVPAPAPSRKNKASKGRKPAAAPAADNSAAGWPFGAPGRGASAYNTFFPIFIGGNSPSGRARTRSANGEEGSFPGSATAIANAFSTGKGSAATSHATSFGDPFFAAAFRNGGLSSRFQAI